MVTAATEPTLDERARALYEEHPEILQAIDLFNIAQEQYQVSLSALQSTKTYVTSSTLLPGQHG